MQRVIKLTVNSALVAGHWVH